jgi:hypothetical protein
MAHFTLRASDFIVYGKATGRLVTDGVIVARYASGSSVSQTRNALRHAVASARLESVPITDEVRLEIVKEAMAPLRARNNGGRPGRRGK